MPLSPGGSPPVNIAPVINTPVDADTFGVGQANKEEVFAADTNRLRAVVSAPAANDQNIRVGDTDVDIDQGIELAPGEAVAIDSTAAIFVCEAVAGTNTAALLEELLA